MKIQNIVAAWIVLIVFAMIPSLGFAQISSAADGIVPTEYAGANQDSIHIFCGTRDETSTSLTATAPNGESATYEWLRYNAVAGTFDPFQSDQSGSTTSTISNLANGAYRVNITSTSGVTTYTAWVFNNYIEPTAEITDSDCNSFQLNGAFESPAFTYTDLVTLQEKVLNKQIQVRWTAGDNAVSSGLTSQVFSPPAEDTDYTLTVSDRFGCVSSVVVRYVSIVTEALFTSAPEAQPSSPTGKSEAPLAVAFTNASVNGDPGKYEWFIYKDRQQIIEESLANPNVPVDSFLIKLYDDSPSYIFEKPGAYNVKLVSQKTSEFNICYDTVYIANFIVVDESFIEAPNFFTPGNDTMNEQFVVRFFSMRTVKISIFNRWGKVVHVYENNNVQGFGPTLASEPQAVWDGKVGGKLATPGVYYWVVDGLGRDDIRRKDNGFVHLFRDK